MIETDSHVITCVMLALLIDPHITRSQLEIGVEHGRVTLIGEVLSEAGRLAAEEVARRQANVVEVINKLRVVWN